jgi:hypothetical protein
MNRVIRLCLTAAVLVAAIVSAQTPQSRSTTRQQANTGGQPSQTVTLIGCLEPATAGSAFVLNVVNELGPSQQQPQARRPESVDTAAPLKRDTSPDQPVGTSGREHMGATGTSGVSFAGQRVQLIGSAQADLSDQVGQKVEITGNLVPQGTARSRPGQPVAPVRINVKNVRSVAATCEAPPR